jgi:ribosome-associated translation inhibitor RaiA
MVILERRPWMNIDTRTIGFELTPALAERVDTQVRSALSVVAEHVVHVTVRLDDVNGDHGGVDQRCRIVATLARHGAAVAAVTSTDLYASIDEAARRLRRSAQRSVTRHLGRERKDPQRPGALVQP